jgi:two-component sensor histidine kinase
VTITWNSTRGDTPHLDLRWLERNGPPVVPPTRRGFGTRLIERGLAQDLGGEVQLTYAPTGVVCIISVPLGAADGGAEADLS